MRLRVHLDASGADHLVRHHLDRFRMLLSLTTIITLESAVNYHHYYCYQQQLQPNSNLYNLTPCPGGQIWSCRPFTAGHPWTLGGIKRQIFLSSSPPPSTSSGAR
jgi:hypothetical protein